MKAFRKLSVWIALAVVFGSISFGYAADKGNFSTAPKNNNGQKWRIGYYEGGAYLDYQGFFTAIIRELMDMGWIESAELPPQQGAQTKELWTWLATQAQSDYLQFVEDAYYTANWDKDLRVKTSAEVINRFNTKNDIDLMLAFGTWAGQDLANDQHHTPTLVVSVSDPLASGIIKSVEDSGYDQIHAHITPGRFEQQIRIFYDIIGFQTLGVTYEDSKSGRSYAAMDDIEKLSQELGFEIVSCHTGKEAIADVKEAGEKVIQCFRELGEKGVNAIYLTAQSGVNENTIGELVNIFNTYQIPSFSQGGSQNVKAGVLMSISRAAFKYIGRFEAEVIAKVFNGAKPREVDQLFAEPPKIAINLKTAEVIGYDPPVDVLGAADEIYQED